MTLPPELRLCIYDAYLDSLGFHQPCEEIVRRVTDHNIFDADGKEIFRKQRPIFEEATPSPIRNTLLLHLSRTTRAEALPLLTRHIAAMRARAVALHAACEATEAALPFPHWDVNTREIVPDELQAMYDRRGALEWHLRDLAHHIEFLETNDSHLGKGSIVSAGATARMKSVKWSVR